MEQDLRREIGHTLVITPQLINREAEHRISAAREPESEVPERAQAVEDSRGRVNNLMVERSTLSENGEPRAQIERYTPVASGNDTQDNVPKETRLISTYALYGERDGVKASAWYEYGINNGRMYKRMHLGLGEESTSVDEGKSIDWDEDKQREVASILELPI